MKLAPMEYVRIVKALRPAAQNVTFVRSWVGVRAFLAATYATGWRDELTSRIAEVFPKVPATFPALIWNERLDLPDAMSCPGSLMEVHSWEHLP